MTRKPEEIIAEALGGGWLPLAPVDITNATETILSALASEGYVLFHPSEVEIRGCENALSSLPPLPKT